MVRLGVLAAYRGLVHGLASGFPACRLCVGQMAEGRLPPVTRGSSTCAWGRLPSPAEARVMPCHACLAFRPWLSVPCQIASVRRIREPATLLVNGSWSTRAAVAGRHGVRVGSRACVCSAGADPDSSIPDGSATKALDGPTGAARGCEFGVVSRSSVRSASPVGSYGSLRWRDPIIRTVYRTDSVPCTGLI